MCSFSGNCAPSVPISILMCLWFIYSQDRFTYFPAAEQVDRSWKYINLSQIYECRNRETEHYNSVLEITVSFLGIHKWELDIYIGFSPPLHLQSRHIDFFRVIVLCCCYIISFYRNMIQKTQNSLEVQFPFWGLKTLWKINGLNSRFLFVSVVGVYKFIAQEQRKNIQLWKSHRIKCQRYSMKKIKSVSWWSSSLQPLALRLYYSERV